MFESTAAVPVGEPPAHPDPVALAAVALADAHLLGAAALSDMGAAEESGAALVDLIAALQRLVAAAEACSARAAAGLDRVRRAEEAAAGVPVQRQGAGVAAEVALARRESAHRGRTMLGLGKILCTEMPGTMARLADGSLTPWRAMLLVRESACLELPDRRRLDDDLCVDPATLEGLGDGGVVGAARRWCAAEDPASVVARRSRAEAERRVTLRPAPDTMTYLTALLPVAQGVAAYAALTRRADTARAEGDDRSRGQVMADALVARVSGTSEGEAPAVLVNLVMTDTSLFTGGTEPGLVPGFGPVPAATARDLVARAGGDAGAFVRRLYAAPETGALVGMDARTRRVPAGLADFVTLRDGGSCRMPWCDAPIRHIDHVRAVVDDGATTEPNLQGLCEAHNYAKQAPGWVARPGRQDDRPLDHRDHERHGADRGRPELGHPGRGHPGRGHPGLSRPALPGDEGSARHHVVTTTPSGHVYRSTAPPLPAGQDRAGTVVGPASSHRDASAVSDPSPGETRLHDAVARRIEHDRWAA